MLKTRANETLEINQKWKENIHKNLKHSQGNVYFIQSEKMLLLMEIKMKIQHQFLKTVLKFPLWLRLRTSHIPGWNSRWTHLSIFCSRLEIWVEIIYLVPRD